jgi:hypothetical protein
MSYGLPPNAEQATLRYFHLRKANSRHHLAAFSVRREDFLAVAAQVNGGVRRFRIVQHPNIGILAELVILLLPP